MCNNYGDLTCAHLTFYEKFGFAENGNFSLKPVEKLVTQLVTAELKKEYKLCWLERFC